MKEFVLFIMSEFEDIIVSLNGADIEKAVKGDRYLEATLAFWEASQSMAAYLKGCGKTFTEAYALMEEKAEITRWRDSQMEAMFSLAWALQGDA